MFLFLAPTAFVSAAEAACTTQAVNGVPTTVCSGDLGEGVSFDADGDNPKFLVVDDLTAEIGDDGVIFFSNASNGSSHGAAGAAGAVLGATVSLDPFGIDARDHALSVTSSGGNGHSGENRTNVVLDVTGGRGGAGGSGGEILVTLQGGDVVTSGGDTAAIHILSQGGNGASGGNGTVDTVGKGTGGRGGNGGHGSTVRIVAGDQQPVTVSTTGDNANGVTIQSIGGDGGNGGNGQSIVAGDSGAGIGFVAYGVDSQSGGGGGNITVTIDDTDLIDSIIETYGDSSDGLFVQSQGGGGGKGSTEVSVVTLGGDGSSAGDGGIVSVQSLGTKIATHGFRSRAVYASSHGGSGGDGGEAFGLVSIGSASGDGGNGGQVSVTNTAELETYGDYSEAIHAASVGGGGGSGHSTAGLYDVGGSGGPGGNGGDVFVAHSGGDITTSGFESDGVFLQSTGGGGGRSSNDFSIGLVAAFVTGGQGGNGGNGGTVTFDDGGAGGYTIRTGADDSDPSSGDNSVGIFAESVGAGGGRTGLALTVALTDTNFSSQMGAGGTAGSAGDGGAVTVNASGSIVTAGANATGILAHSVGLGGGAAGSVIGVTLSSGLNFGANNQFGATAGVGGNGGAVSVASNGTIDTSGDNSIGILAQSAGGGGGSGGTTVSAGLVSFNNALGSSGGGGGDGSTVAVSGGGDITTRGSHSDGILAQSIGGGGGNSGTTVTANINALLSLDFTHGTSGGDGGDSADVKVDYSGNISTSGDSSSGINAQSVANGGGNAGFSAAFGAGGGLSAAFTLGGEGGAAGISGNVEVNAAGTIVTSGSQSNAIEAVSLAHGGGNGGAVLATTAGSSASDTVLVDLSVAIGGEGGDGGTAGDVKIVASGDLTTTGDQSHAISAQSLGGGGGTGGFATAFAVNLSDPRYAPGLSGSLALGGSGGDSGTAGRVDVTSSGAITTEGYRSFGILAQSQGGDGGDGAAASAATAASAFTASVSIGGGGGNGNAASTVMVDNEGSIFTAGDYSTAIYAHSHGGDGGTGGMALTGAMTINFEPTASAAPAITVSVGGSGGDGNRAGTVTVDNDGAITTTGYAAIGIDAQSLGGSGGAGGAAVSGTFAFSVAEETTALSVNVDVGGAGGNSNRASTVTVDNRAPITTGGYYAPAIQALSVGGDGGNGGASIAAVGVFSATAAKASVDATVSIGGAGGSGNHAGAVSVSNAGALSTASSGSAGIFAQSAGGGGGNGGSANTFVINRSGTIDEIDNPNGVTVNLAYTMGGTGGASGDGEAVTIDNTGTITTAGDDSAGIFAESIGGGGGDGGSATSFAILTTLNSCTVPVVCQTVANFTRANIDVSIGGNGGASGDGGEVIVGNSGTIETTGAQSLGIYAHSIGGGGGTGGNGNIGTEGWLTPELATAVGFFKEGVVGFTGTVNSFETAKVAIGGSGGANGDGGNVSVTNAGAITTSGEDSHAIFAQSVGGGGGNGGAALNSVLSTFSLAGSGSADGDGGMVTVENSAAITTTGDYAMGIFAQSVGGGGGTAGRAGSAISPDYGTMTTVLGIPIPVSPVANRKGDGDSVLVETTGPITTSGAYAHAIFAQSIGGGGGARQLSTDEAVTTLLGSLSESGTGGDVTVRALDDVTVSGANAVAIFAQSAGGFVDSADSVTIEIGGEISATGEGGRAILTSQSNYLHVGGPTTITVNEGGWVHTGAGTAETIALFGAAPGSTITNYGTIESTEDGEAAYVLRYQAPALSNYFSLTVDNHGTMNGSVLLDPFSSSIAHVFTNSEGGSLGLGMDFDLSTRGTLINDGAMSAATVGTIGTSSVNGNVSQGSGGQFWADLTVGVSGDTDPTADLVAFSSLGATLGGSITGNMVGLNLLLPGESGSVLVASSADGVIDVSGLTAASTGVVTYGFEKTEDAPGVNEELYLTYDVDYSAPGANLGAGHLAFAGHFEDLIGRRIEEVGLGGGDLAWVENLSNHILNARGDDLTDLYQSFTPDFVAFAPLATSLAANQSFANSLYSCPASGIEARIDFAHQGECTWLQSAGRYTGQGTANGYLAYDEAAFGLSAGFQAEVGTGAFIGAGLFYELVSLDGSLSSSGTGTRFQAGGVAKIEHDDWIFAANLTGGLGSYDLSREVMAPSGSLFAASSPETAFISAGAMVAREFDLGSFFVKPSVSAAITYMHQGAVDESGAAPYDMHIGAANVTAFSVNPAIEIGRDVTLEDGRDLRAFVRGGLLATTQSDSEVDVSFLANPLGDGFTVTGPSDDLYADLALGLDAGIKDDISVRIAGQALLADGFHALGGLVKLRVGF